MLVQNRRAEHLLAAADGASEGRRRAVEINNMLLEAFLARAGEAPRESRELNLVNPADGTDLLLEVITHPLAGQAKMHRCCSPCCATSPTCAARHRSSSARSSACGAPRCGRPVSATGWT